MASPASKGRCYKGVENFLRRVAYNLGNSPSQTEVKIISCIPIDVTDLQQKISCLEKQLEQANCEQCSMQCQVAVHTALTAADAPAPPCEPTPPPSPPPIPICPPKKSTISFLTRSQKSKTTRDQKEPQDHKCSSGILNDTETRKKNPFKRNRRPRKHSPLVYYAQTTATPFTKYRKEKARREMERMRSVELPFVSELLRKQYMAEAYVEPWSRTSSQASAPVCRDARAPPACDPDACSCCRGRFYDLDREYRPYPFLADNLPASMHQNVDSGNIYYNSSYYDIYPVKEKPDRAKREADKLKTWEQTLQYDNSCLRQYYRTNIECRPVLMNTKLAQTPRCTNRKLYGKLAKRRDRVSKRLLNTNESSGNTIVECGDVYAKRQGPKKRKREKVPNKTILLKNVECLTLNVNDTECQTESSKNVGPGGGDQIEENQTETTLNQIKSILQSVLSHVKVNDQLKRQTESKEKKDAVVQKELQANSPVCSRLLNSYTYSPFAMDPYMMSASYGAPAACPSVVMPPQPASHFKCMQNFPVFIQQAPTHRPCTHPRPQVTRHPNQTSMNTSFPTEEKRSKETEDLIKEIYKSLALNIPLKQTSNIDTRPRNVSPMEGDAVISNMMTMSRQVGPRGRSEKAKQLSVSTATTSRATSSTRSALVRVSGDKRSAPSAATGPRRSRPASYRSGTTTTSVSASERRPRQRPIVDESDTLSEDGESASNDSDSDDTVTVPDNDKQSVKSAEKKGIFKKMFGSVFRRRRKLKHSEDRSSSVAESDSDSDDYQTVYSQKVERPKRVTYAQDRPKRTRLSLPRVGSPYLEPEHRYWDEQLMFQRQNKKNTSERTTARPRIVRRPPGIYFHKYQARPTLVETSSPFRWQPDSDTRLEQAPTPRKVGLKVPSGKTSWLKKCSPKCGEQWKKLLLES